VQRDPRHSDVPVRSDVSTVHGAAVMTSSRLPARQGMRETIDRSRPITFRFDDVEYPALEGDTIATALLANGVEAPFRSPILGRPRGVFSSGAEEPNAFVEISERWFDPIVAATMVDLVDGMVVESRPGVGRIRNRIANSR